MKFWRQWHKWLGLLLAIQLLLWISGGVVMSIIPLDKVRGQHLIERTAPEYGSLPMTHIDMSQWKNVRWVRRLDKMIVEAQSVEGDKLWFDPQSNQPLSNLTPEQIRETVQRQYLGDGNVIDVFELQTLPGEVRHLDLPLYQVNFNDWIHTSFYIHPSSGQILSVRSDVWRLFDFFWMLHILDFEEREDFNNPLLISLAIGAWLFTLSGFVMLYHSLFKPHWRKWQYKKGM